MLQKVLEAMPVVAILRGVQPAEVADIGKRLYDGGLRCLEVPLNSPAPFDSIEILSRAMSDDCMVGAGTVLTGEHVRNVRNAGGNLIVAPNTSQAVIQEAVALGMQVAPGVATPTDVFAAIEAGARYLKLFPASTYGPGHLKALSAVVPDDVRFLAVGGIGPKDFSAWLAAGAIGFGIGSELYRAGDSPADVEKKLAAIRTAMTAAVTSA